MNDFIKKYRGFGYGLITLVILLSVLSKIDFILINPNHHLENSFFFLLWWIILSLPFYKFNYIKKKKSTVFKILGIVSLLVLLLIVDDYMAYPDNPISIVLLITFWLSILFVLLPDFFNKYKTQIISFYILAVFYFTYMRLFSESYEYYLNNRKEIAMTFLLLPIPLLILLWVFEQWKWLKTLKAEKAQAELTLLKAQINPHFFFNTLNNLHALSVKNSQEAPGVILKLSAMMRYTIYEGKKEHVLLHDEVEYLNNYIDLHKIRYHKKVDISFNRAITHGDQAAPLIFIVLLENAFKHGAEKMTEDAYIHLDLISNGKVLNFTVENNFDPSEVDNTSGIGLENLKRRLDLIYPKKYDMQINRMKNVYKVELKININD